MRRVSNVFVWLGAAAVCAVMTWITMDSSLSAVISNLAFLAVMAVIILIAEAFGFRRMNKTIGGLNTAQEKLVSVYKNRNELVDITKPGAEIFRVEYLDRKYQEYLGYLRKTNSPCDIGDYIGEYEINNYTHRRLVEMVPDILTSLGILGTFMGLVWGLRGFNPVSYEAMASSITSLINGIKVAFITSIYGIVLALAFQYTLRGKLTGMSEALDGFIDKYYLCAVTPTDATAMNHILANQHEQIKATQSLGADVGEQVASSVAEHMDPLISNIMQSMQTLTDTMTGTQEQVLENVAVRVSNAMKKEFVSEFAEMRTILKETNNAEKEFLKNLQAAQDEFHRNMAAGSDALNRALKQTAAENSKMSQSLNEQQEYMREFAGYMSRAMQSMSDVSEANAKAGAAMNTQLEAMNRILQQTIDYEQNAQNAAAQASAKAKAADAAADRAEEPVQRTKIDDISELTGRLDDVIILLEKQNRQIQQQQSKKRGFFR